MKVATAKEMREIDRVTIEERGIPGEVLMALAGRAVADFAADLFPAKDAPFVVFCGAGNNGGDGFVAAYQLSQWGHAVRIICAGDPSRFTPPTRMYYDLCVKSGVPILKSGTDAPDLSGTACVIDSLTGTGFSGTPAGPLETMIRCINDADVTVISVDMPSGLPSDGEAPAGEAILADYTVTVGLTKPSLVTYPGKHYSGVVRVADIGFPSDLTCSDSIPVDLLDEELATSIASLAHNPAFLGHADSDKFARGHLLLAGGFDGMEGAIIMSAAAALETGAGLVTVLTTPSARKIISGRLPEIITASIPDGKGPDMEQFMNSFFAARQYDAIVTGPGLGRDGLARIFYRSLVGAAEALPLRGIVIDGDGLYHLAAESCRVPEALSKRCLITPHFGEASRLTRKPAEELKAARLRSATELAAEAGCAVLLKGPASIVSDAKGRTRINTSGCPALSAAGSGDVLSGIAGALMLRGLDAGDAGALAAFIHGRAGERASEGGVLKATDIIGRIREVMSPLFDPRRR